jgi:GxxExxY protein
LRWIAGAVGVTPYPAERRIEGNHGATEDAERRKTEMLIYEDLTNEIIGAAIEVHKEIGPGLLESAYEECLCRELSMRNLQFQRQVPLPVSYKGVRLDCGYKMDLVVADKVVLELKAVEETTPLHQAQLLTYLRLSGKRVGLLMNFNVELMKDGVTRLAV